MVINPIVGVYITIVRIPIKGGMTIPNIATFDHGTILFLQQSQGPISTDQHQSNPSYHPPRKAAPLEVRTCLLQYITGYAFSNNHG